MNLYLKIAATVIVPAMLLSCQGRFFSQSTTIKHAVLWHADLDDYREIQLSSVHLQTYSSEEPKRENRQLILKILPKESFVMDRVIENTELKTDKTHEILCEDVEMRTDQNRKKVWFVYKPTRHVIGTVDLENGKTTGPYNKTPTWATPDGGLLIRTACKAKDYNPPSPPSWAFPE